MTFQVLDPLDPNEVKDYEWDFIDDTKGNAITGFQLLLPAGLNAGDGVTQVATPAGTITPPAPVLSGFKIKAWIYASSGTLGWKDLTAHVTTANTAHDLTFSIEVRPL